MLCARAVIALTRSASGHAANEGGLVLPELMDWLHLLAASFWGGGLIALSSLILLMTVKPEGKNASLFAQIAMHYSSIAVLSFGIIVVTAAYNAWLQMGSFHAVWETSYGQTLILKFLLSVALVVLGVSRQAMIILLSFREIDKKFFGICQPSRCTYYQYKKIRNLPQRSSRNGTHGILKSGEENHQKFCHYRMRVYERT